MAKLQKDILKEIKDVFGDVEVADPITDRPMADKWETEKAGDYLVGEISRIQSGEFGRMVFLRTPKGKEYLLKNRRGLTNQLETVKVGSRLIITCLGWKKPAKAGGREFIGYEVREIKGGVPF